MTHSDSLYLSPHLDDAVLSCAARIRQETATGMRVVVATLFADGDLASRAAYRRRRAEDTRAIASLGASAIHLRLRDAPFRRQYYSSFRTIVLGSHPADGEDEDEAKRVLGNVLRRVNPERIYCPLGIGTHIDHRLTYQAATAVCGFQRLTFYEDRPYVFVPGHLPMRLAELSLHGDVQLVAAGQYLQAFREAMYVQTYLDEVDRNACEKMLLQKLPASALRGRRVVPEMVVSTSTEEVLTAITLYETQLTDLYGDVRGLQRESQAYSASLGSPGYVERYWRVEAKDFS